MIKKLKLTIYLLFIFLVGCGFNSVLKNKPINFSIESINTSGDININQNILSNLVNYRNNSEMEKKYYIKINSIQNRYVTSKDTKGDPKTYRIEIQTIIEVVDINKNFNKKEFLEKKDYNTMSSKFDLSLYENNIRKNLSNIISRNISIYLNTLN